MFIILDLDSIEDIKVVKEDDNDDSVTLMFWEYNDALDYAERHVVGEYHIVELDI